jgi:hypothetical protein
MSPLIIAMAIFVLGWRLRAVERVRYSGSSGSRDRIGPLGVIYLIIMAALIFLRYHHVT